MRTPTLTDAAWSALLDHLDACSPGEGAALLGGPARGGRVDRIWPLRGDMTETRFDADAPSLIGGLRAFDDAGARWIALAHSHPAGPACLSDADRAALRFADGGACFPGVFHLVIGPARRDARAAVWHDPDALQQAGPALEVRRSPTATVIARRSRPSVG